MAMDSGVYGPTLDDQFDGTASVNLEGDTIKVTLHTDGFTASFDSDAVYTDLDAELSDAGTTVGYNAGGTALVGNKAVTVASGEWKFDTDGDTQWTSATLDNVEGRVIYSSNQGNRLILATDFTTPYSVTSGTLTIQENASGIWTIDYIP